MHLKTVIIISVFVGAGNFQPLHAQPNISVSVEPGEITVGDPIELTIRVRLEGYKQVVLPSADKLSPFEVLKIDTLKDSKKEIAIKYTITHFEAGEQELKDIPIIFLKDAGVDSAVIQAGAIYVQTVLQDADSTAQIKDIHPPVKMEWLLADILPFLWIALGIIAAGVLGYYVRRRWFGGGKLIEELMIPAPPPYDTAIRNLEELRIKRLWQQGYLVEFYSELTEIIKHYIGGRYEFDAPEMTTDELMHRQNIWSSSEETLSYVHQIVTCADLVKFASYTPEPSTNEENLTAGFDYLRATRPQAVIFSDNLHPKPNSISQQVHS